MDTRARARRRITSSSAALTRQARHDRAECGMDRHGAIRQPHGALPDGAAGSLRGGGHRAVLPEHEQGLDVLLAHPNADPDRVAVAGLSGGGWQTIFISSLDERVKLANPVAGYSSFKTRAGTARIWATRNRRPTISRCTRITRTLLLCLPIARRC